MGLNAWLLDRDVPRVARVIASARRRGRLARGLLRELRWPRRSRERPEPIADNSFLIEEAYNQEAGVVQHISTFVRPDGGGAWAYSFTQEWPFPGMRHQLSYTIPVLHDRARGTGLGDIAPQLPLPARGRWRRRPPRGPPR